jgi:hypothetical protein
VFVCMQQQSGVMETIHGWTLDSNVRAAKERLDQKLRRKREAVIKSTAHTHGNRLLKKERIDIAPQHREHRQMKGPSLTSFLLEVVQHDVYSKKDMIRRLMRWGRPQCDAAEHDECAVCLDDFRTGDVLAHLPCGHRFHLACALQWLEVTPRCPFCRAGVEAGGNSNRHGHVAAA